MIVRPYRESDLEAVVSVFTASVHQLAVDHYDDAQRAAWAPKVPDHDGWRARLATLCALVAEDEDELVGFVAHELDGHVDLLYVAPARARRGVALALHRELEARMSAAGVDVLFAEVSLVARPFFLRQGYRVVAEETVARRGVDFRRFIMHKSLSA